jgi:cardiolipin synthase
LVVFVVAGLTDGLDGIAARMLHQETSFGRLLDPIADKLLTTAAFIALAVPRENAPSIPVWLAASVVGRDLIIAFGSLLVYLTVGFTQFKPSLAGKINTCLEIAIIACFLGVHTLGSFGSILPAGYVIVLLSVFVSGVGYIVKGVSIHRTARVESTAKSPHPVDPAG